MAAVWGLVRFLLLLLGGSGGISPPKMPGINTGGRVNMSDASMGRNPPKDLDGRESPKDVRNKHWGLCEYK